MDQDLKLKMDMLCSMQKTFKELYEQYFGLVAIRSNEIQISDELFLNMFDDYLIERNYSDGYDLLSAYYNGVKFIALKEVVQNG